MIRLLTAAAMVALLASPVMAQSVSPSDQYNSGSSSTLQNQGPATSPGSTSSESMGTQLSPGLSTQTPTDCAPNDIRPECQTAELPNQDNSSAGPGASGSMTYPSERGNSGSSGSSGSSSPGSGTMDR
ncbi:MAG: hypothetical protein H7Y60_09985 [Rhodospirillaceae bacterium]|nr:hypothetical protein [Rhodospirillales bacterium]